MDARQWEREEVRGAMETQGHHVHAFLRSRKRRDATTPGRGGTYTTPLSPTRLESRESSAVILATSSCFIWMRFEPKLMY